MSFTDSRRGRPARRAGSKAGRPALEILEERLAPATGALGSALTVVPVGASRPAAVMPAFVAAATLASKTTVTPSITTSVVGQPVTFTAKVEPATGTGTPTGNVVFSSGALPLGTAAVIGGLAILPVTNLPVGMPQVTGAYQGDATFLPSTSPAITQTVKKADSIATVTPSPASTSPGNPVQLTAKVIASPPGAGTPGGSVKFLEGTTVLGTQTLTGGMATQTVPSFPTGTHKITVHYAGDTNFNPVDSAATTVTISAPASKTTLTASTGRSLTGQPVTFTAVVAPATGTGTPTGTVGFFSGATALGTVTLTNGTAAFTTSALPTGTDSVTATYNGSDAFQSSTSTATSVVVQQAATTTTLTIVPRPSSLGQAATLTATVVPVAPGGGTPTGTVQFFGDGKSLGTATLQNGKAVLNVSNLAVGRTAVTATYSGDTGYTTSTSAPVTQPVGTANQLWLNAVYLAVLQRPIDDASLAKWSAALDRGQSRLSIVNAILHSTEARTVEVQTVFQTYLGRAATPREVSNTIAAARAFGNDLRVPVLTSQEYIQSRGNGTTDGYVMAVSNDVAGRQAVDSAYAALHGQLNLGYRPLQVAEQVLHSQAAYVSFVQTTFHIYLGRTASAKEVAHYTGELSRGVSTREVLAEVLASQEFYNKASTVA